MGITIHYSGRFNPAATLSNMIEEVEEIASIYQWPFRSFEREFDDDDALGLETYTDKIYGIGFTPPESETVFICFLSNGRMSSPVNLMIWANSEKEEEKQYLYNVFAKTQFAGPAVHKTVVQLLKYIESKYLLDLDVHDEGNYWNTLDEQLLEKTFVEYGSLIDAFKNMLENIPKEDGEETEDYLHRLTKYIRKKRDND